MKLLVIGSAGQLGWELMRPPRPARLSLIGLDRSALDITRPEDVAARVAESGCEVVVNTAAYTAVDKAQTEPKTAFAVNRDGAAHIAAACAAAGTPLIHISTDYVFDGTKSGAYIEVDPVRPLGIYGMSKEAGERAVRERLGRHVILRTAWVYGAHGHNFVKTMLRAGRERDELAVVADQVGCPTAAADIAAAILEIARQAIEGKFEGWGTYHYCGAGATSWHGFAETIFDLALPRTGRRPRIKAITTADHPTAARRPANSVLDCSRLTRTFGIGPKPWRDSLAALIAELLQDELRGSAA